MTTAEVIKHSKECKTHRAMIDMCFTFVSEGEKDGESSMWSVEDLLPFLNKMMQLHGSLACTCCSTSATPAD
jgi:hypothetical protein